MGLLYRQKQNLYLLVIISGDPILHKDSMIYFKTEPIKVIIEEWRVVISFDILLLGKDEAVLGMPFLQKFNPKINWITKTVKVNNTQSQRTQQQTKLI